MSHSPNNQHLLLDIEGTTCPVNFVSDVLFPYARKQLLPYLRQHHAKPSIRSLLSEIQNAWQNDDTPEAIALAKGLNRQDLHGPSSHLPELSPEQACAYLSWLIQQDRKLTALKDLQGLIWQAGYKQNELIAPLFSDVPPALHRWHQDGIALSVYSSGSVQAQKLLYANTNAGDLSHLFSHWFDTRTGPKNDPESYIKIAAVLEADPQNILFVSDAPAELAAARSAQMLTTFSCRPGNPYQDAEGHSKIESFSELRL